MKEERRKKGWVEKGREERKETIGRKWKEER